MALNNLQPGELGNWLDYSQGGARPGADASYNPNGTDLTLAEDCAYVLAADFPEVQGPFVLSGCTRSLDCGFATTNSADMLNALGGRGDNTPLMTPFSAPCPTSLSLPDHELPSVGAGFGTGGKHQQKASKANARAPKRGPPARGGVGGSSAGGRRGTAKKPARGREADSRLDAPGPVGLLFKGTIGGSGSVQELSMPWTLSLQQLNRTIAPPEEAWPVADS